MTTDHRHRRTRSRHRRSPDPGLRPVWLRFAASLLLSGAFVLWLGAGYAAAVSVPGAAVGAAFALPVTYLGFALLRRAGRA